MTNPREKRALHGVAEEEEHGELSLSAALPARLALLARVRRKLLPQLLRLQPRAALLARRRAGEPLHLLRLLTAPACAASSASGEELEDARRSSRAAGSDG